MPYTLLSAFDTNFFRKTLIVVLLPRKYKMENRRVFRNAPESQRRLASRGVFEQALMRRNVPSLSQSLTFFHFFCAFFLSD
jgi:hypothetical protein